MGGRILQIGSCAEGAARVVAGQNYAANGGVVFEFRQPFAHPILEIGAPGVARLGTAESQNRDMANPFTEQRHDGFLPFFDSWLNRSQKCTKWQGPDTSFSDVTRAFALS